MGADKALLEFGGRPLLARTLETLASVADELLVVGARPEYAAFGALVVPDDDAEAGPLGGIATALRVARHEFTLIVACDMPLLSAAFLRAMAAEPRDYDVLLPCVSPPRGAAEHAGEARPHPLHAIYARRCQAVFKAGIASGRLAVLDNVHELRVRQLDDCWARRHSLDGRSTLNSNTAAEFAEARRFAGHEDGRQDG
jgi:molybdopterin-guanine dinucleotide biosynthesis protein A